MNRREFVKGAVAGDAAKMLPPKALSGSSIKSSVLAIESFVDERIAGR